MTSCTIIVTMSGSTIVSRLTTRATICAKYVAGPNRTGQYADYTHPIILGLPKNAPMSPKVFHMVYYITMSELLRDYSLHMENFFELLVEKAKKYVTTLSS